VNGGQGAAAMARGQIYAQLNRQAATLGYGDVYRLMFWMSVGMMFCALLLSKNKPGEGAPAGEGAA
jgi:DHA2 family multidrug resistance protein